MEFLRGPQKAEPIVRTREGRASGPNPFLDEGWLQESYDTEETMSVIVGGHWEERQRMNRQKELLYEADGSPAMQTVLVGDAATAVALIRRAADFLGIGVVVDPVPAVSDKTGRELKGQVEVRYKGKERKAPRASATSDE